MTRTSWLAALFSTMVFFFGCSSVDEVTKSDEGMAGVDDQAGEASTYDSMDPQSRTEGLGESSGYSSDALNDPGNPLSVRVIYFDYDSYEIKPEYRSVIEAHAAFLSRDPNRVLTLQGHTDERGSREYNLALGERRAKSVERQLTVLGVGTEQIRTSSYGEEQPAIDGHDEESYARNRRAELIY